MSDPTIEYAIRRHPDGQWQSMMRVYRYLVENGPSHRDKIMHWSGFESPREQPVCAYVSFAAAVMRLDTALRACGRCISGGISTGEVYKIEVLV